MFRNWIQRLAKTEQNKRRKKQRRKDRRTKFQNAVGRSVQMEPLEERHLLTTFVNNTGELTEASVTNFGNDNRLATSFTTGVATQLNSVTIDFNDNGGNQVAVSLHADGGTDPGAQIVSLGTASPANDTSHTFMPASSTPLAANTTYWVQVLEDNANDMFALDETASDAQSGQTGWSIGDIMRRSSDGATWVTIGGSLAMQFSVNASATATIDLQATSDTGASNTDNITGDLSPTFDIGNLETDATIELLRDSTVVATITSGLSTTTTNTIMDPGAPEGTYDYTVRVTGADTMSTTSAALEVTIVEATSTYNAGNESLTIGGSDTGSDVTITRNGANIDINDANSPLLAPAAGGAIQVDGNTIRIPVASLDTGANSGIIFNGNAGDDEMTVDLDNGNPGVNITFNGGTQGAGGDGLTVEGGSDGDIDSVNVTHSTPGNAANGNDGTVGIDFDGGGTATITFTGLEPVLINTAAPGSVEVNFPTSSDSAQIAHSGATGSGLFTISETSGTPTFESTTFPYPVASGSLTINMNDGTDSLTFVSPSLEFNANTGVTIDGEGGSDTVSINQATTITGDLDVTAETINQTATLTASAAAVFDAGASGTITLTNTGNDFQGTTSVDNAAAADLTDTDDITLGGSSTTGNYTVISGGTIEVDGAYSKTAGAAATYRLNAANGINVNDDIESTNNALNVVLNSDSDNTDGGGIFVGFLVASNGGNITLGGGAAPAAAVTGPAVGNADNSGRGVWIQGGDLDATGDPTSGNITIRGTGGTESDTNHGVLIENDTVGNPGLVQTGGAGTITIVGTAGTGTSMDDDGVTLLDTGPDGTAVTSGSGAIQIDGTSATDDGVDIDDNTSVTSTSGNITITGTSTSPSAANEGDGVVVFGTISTGGSVGAAISIVGTSSDEDGVNLTSNTQIDANGDATISIAGTSTGTDDGVDINLGSDVVAESGTIMIAGTANAASAEDGVTITNARVESTSGNITIAGTSVGTTSGDDKDGVEIDSSTVETATGSIQISGQTAGEGDGVRITSDPSILITMTAPTATIQIQGTATNAADGGDGVDISVGEGSLPSGPGIHTVDSTISITGTTASDQDGVEIDEFDITTTSGDIDIDGSSAGDDGVDIGTGASIVAVNNAAITIDGTSTTTGTTGNSGVVIHQGSDIQSTGTTNGATISISGTGGPGTDNNNGVHIIGTTIAPFTVVSSANGTIDIDGTGNGTGDDNVGVRIEDNADVTGTGSATINIDGTGSTGGVDDNDGVLISGTGTTVDTAGGNIVIAGTGGGTFDDNMGVRVNPFTLVESATGGIDIDGTGGGGTGGGNNRGIAITGATVRQTGTGATTTIDLDGTGGAANDNNDGVLIFTGLVSSVDGNIEIDGTGVGTTDSNDGVELTGTLVDSTGTGTDAATITINGTGAAGTSDNDGVRASSLATVQSIDGDIVVTGTGGLGSSTDNDGVSFSGGADVFSNGTTGNAATITITGTTAAGTSESDGVHITGSGTTVDSDGGAIQINGTSNAFRGVRIDSAADVVGNNAATIEINGTSTGPMSPGQGVFIAGTDTDVMTADGTIVINGTASGADAAAVVNSGSATISSTNGMITLNGTATGTGTGADGVHLQTNSLVTNVNGEIELNGTSTNGDGVEIQTGADVTSTGTGAQAGEIDINGTANGASGVRGVFIHEQAGFSDTIVRSVDGNIAIDGTSSQVDATNAGVLITNNSEVTGVTSAEIRGTSHSPYIVSGGATMTTPALIILKSTDTADPDFDDLNIIDAGTLVQSTASTVTLNVGDDLLIGVGATVQAADEITINLDGFNTPEVGADASLAVFPDTENDLFGTVQSDNNGIFINGGADYEEITVDSDGDTGGDMSGTLDNLIVATGFGLVVDGGGVPNSGNDNGGNPPATAGDRLILVDHSDTTGDVFSITDTTISEMAGEDLFGGFTPGDGLTYANLDRVDIRASNVTAPTPPALSDGDVATVFSLDPNTLYDLDGNEPILAAALLDADPGDTLILQPAGSISAYEIDGEYKFEFENGGNLVTREWETIILRPGNGVLNVVGDEGQGLQGGDNNGAGTDEADHIQLIGTEVGEGRLIMDHDGAMITEPPRVIFEGVTDINVRTFEENDELEISPFANDQPQGWGIDISYDAGADGATGSDWLTLHTSDGDGDSSMAGNHVQNEEVSENIVIRPSGVGAGDVIVTNASSGTLIVDIDYVSNRDFVILDDDAGLASDIDTLTLLGLNPDSPSGPGALDGNDYIDVNLTNAGTAAAPHVSVIGDLGTDGSPGGTATAADSVLYNLRNMNPLFGTLNINSLGGDDTIAVVGRTQGDVTLEVDGGSPADADIIRLVGVVDSNDDFTVKPGPTSDSGVAEAQRSGATPTTINFNGISRIQVDGGGGTGVDDLFVDGTFGNDQFTMTDANPGSQTNPAGTIWVNDGPAIHFFALATGGSDVELNGFGGDDDFFIHHDDNWNLDVEIDGGAPTTGSDSVLILGEENDSDVFTVNSDRPNGADVSVTSDGGTTTADYNLVNIEALTVDGNECYGECSTSVDVLNLSNERLTVTPTSSEAGFVEPFEDADGVDGTALLKFNYAEIEDANAATGSGSTIKILGSQGDDEIIVDANGTVTVTSATGSSSFDAAGANSLTIDALGGDDSIIVNVDGTTPLFAGGIDVMGGDNGDGSDDLTVNATGGDDNIDINIGGSSVTVNLGGATSFTGIEHLTVNGNGTAVAGGDDVDVTNYGAASGLETLSIRMNDEAGDALDVSGTSGDNNIAFRALGATSGQFTQDTGDAVINYSNMEATAPLTVQGGSGGTDVLTILGTEAGDTITSNGSTITAGDIVTFGAGLDRLDVFGFAGNDSITITADLVNGDTPTAAPLPAVLHGGDGDDTANAAAVSNVGITFFGGAGNDTATGGAGADLFDGGSGNDRMDGNGGVDRMLGGADSDIFIWNPGDGADIIEGGTGVDRVNTTSNGNTTVGSSGARVTLNPGASMDLADVEHIDISNSADSTTTTVNDLSGTGVQLVTISDGGDGDRVNVWGTTGDDNVNVEENSGTVSVTGLSAIVEITGGEDVHFNGDDGNDTLTTSGATPTVNTSTSTITGVKTDNLTYSNTESLVINAGTALTISGATSYEVTPGAATDEGTVVAGTLPIHYTGVGSGELLTLTGASGSITVHGTDSSDSFNLSGDNLTVSGRATVVRTGSTILNIDGHDGDDNFVVANNGYTTVNLHGGDPSASDVVELNASGSAVILTLNGDGTAMATGGNLSTTNIDSVEIVELNNGGQATTIRTSGLDDTLHVTPDVDRVTAVLESLNPQLDVLGMGAVTADLAGGNDTLVVHGTSGDDTIDVDGGMVDITAPTRAAVSYTNAESLQVLGADGTDTFNVTSDADIPIFIDGGDPIGGNGDTLNVTSGATVTINAGPESDEGSIVIDNDAPVSYDHIENLGPFSAPSGLTLSATNGDDAITIIARDDSTHAGADGDQDFTVTINDGPELFFQDTPALVVDALGGSDEIVVRAPAPNNAVWDVDLAIRGGSPSASDRLVYEGIGSQTDDVSYTPDDNATAVVQGVGIRASVSGPIGNDINVSFVAGTAGTPTTTAAIAGDDITVTLATNVGGMVIATALDVATAINIAAAASNGEVVALPIGDGSRVVAETAVAVFLEAGGEGSTGFLVVQPTDAQIAIAGIEELVFDGQGSDDTVTVFGDGSNAIDGTPDTFTHHAGAANDQGSVGVDNGDRTLLGLNYTNLGLFGEIGVDGKVAAGTTEDDVLEVFGSALDDNFDVTGTNVDQNIRITLNVTDINELAIHALQGNDSITIDADDMAYDNGIDVRGGDSDSSTDSLTVNGTAMMDTIDVDVAGDGTVDGIVIGTITLPGIEELQVNAAGAADDEINVSNVGSPSGLHTLALTGGETVALSGTMADDNINVTPTAAGAGTVTADFGPLVAYQDATVLTSVSGGGGFDVVGILGSEDADVVTSADSTSTPGNGVITSNGGAIEVVTADVERVDISTFGGNDDIDLDALPSLNGPAGAMDYVVDAGADNDVVDLDGVTSDDVRARLHGGSGNDTLIGVNSATGSSAGDFLYGGPGDDVLEGGRGQDWFFGEGGNDLLIWVAGDGSDVMEGGTGDADELNFVANDGDNRLEVFGGGRFVDPIDLGATPIAIFGDPQFENTSRAVFALNSDAQNQAQVFLSLGEVEHIDINAHGGTDQIVINNQVDTADSDGDAIQQGTDLSATGVRSIEVNLSDIVAGGLDMAADNIEVHGGLGDDNIAATVQSGSINVTGIGVDVRISDAEVDTDNLFIHGQDGDDVIKAAAGVEAVIGVTLAGDAGDDFLSADATLLGGPDDDTLQGGAGDDTYDGGDGDDLLLVSGGDDTMIGGAGFDIVRHEDNEFSSARSFDQTGSVVTVDGGTTGTFDLTGSTTVERLDLIGNEGDDGLTVSGITVPALIDAGDGNDIVDASGVTATTVEIHGGAGDDVLIGGALRDTISGDAGNDSIWGLADIDTIYGGSGNDVIIGGTGNDVLFGGADADTLIWDPGDNNDLMEGGTGEDELAFNGGAGADTFTMSQVGTRLRFERLPGNVVLDVADVENVDVNRDVILTATLDEAQADAGNGTGSAATGTASLRFDAVNNTVSVDVTVTGTLSGAITAFHLHQAPAGSNGGVIAGFRSPGPANFIAVPGGVRLVATDIPLFASADPAEIMAGNVYLNLHTTAFPAGEIRGQMAVDTTGASVDGDDTFTVFDLGATSVRSVDLNVDAPGATTADDMVADSVTLHGDTVADDVNISLSGTTVDVAGLSTEVHIHNASIAGTQDVLIVEGNEGDDSIKAEPGVENTIGIWLEGGAGDDFLSADATLNGGAGDDLLIGGAGPDTINGGDGDDTIDGRGGANTIDGGAGTDTILVSGTDGDNEITVDHSTTGTLVISEAGTVTNPSPSAGTNTISNVEQVHVNAEDGDDTVNILMGSGGLDYLVHGGDPIGVVGDTLNLTASAAPSFQAGPEGDSGGFKMGTDNVSFDEIEAVSVDLSNVMGNATITGTGGDDEITAEGDANTAGTVDVTVNDGPTVTYISADELTLDGAQGDDDITIDINNAALGVEFNAIGGLPASDNDQLRVTGVDGTLDNPTFTPSGSDSGRLSLANQSPIDADGIELLTYDGEGDNETLTLTGSGRFVHTPGDQVDAGNLTLGSQLGIDYENLGAGGTVVANGSGGGDTLVALGTEDSDLFQVTFSAAAAIDIDLSSQAGTHVDLTSTAVESFEIRSREGDDDIRLNPNGANPLVNAGNGTLAIYGGGPSAGSDTLHLAGAMLAETVLIRPDAMNPDDQDITGLGAQIDATGIELIRYLAADTNDRLTVNPGAGDNEVRVEAAHAGNWDVVQSDSLPAIEYLGLQFLTVDASGDSGSDIVTFKTLGLAGAVAANYQLLADNIDSLVIEGTDGGFQAASPSDSFVVQNPATGSVMVTDNLGNTGQGLTVTETSGDLGSVHLNTLGGDDLVVVDFVDGFVAPLIGYDGGTGSDTLQVQGGAGVAVVYNPGPNTDEGRLTYNATATVIDFVGLEPVIDLVPGTLTVNGTDADNAIDYREGSVATRGLVAVDEFETIEFSNKTALTLNGNAGDDVIHLNNGSTPTALAGITVNGNNPTASDSLIVNGLAATTVAVAHTGADSGTIMGAEPVTVTYDTIEHLTVNAATSTTLAVSGSADYIVNPGAEEDQGDVLSSGVPITYDGYGDGETVALTGTGGGEVTVNGTDANDLFTVANNEIELNARATVTATTLPTATLNGYEGHDEFDVDGNQDFTTLNVHGGDGDDDDLLDANNPSGAVTVDLGDSTVVGFGGTINYTGLQEIEADAGGAVINVVGTDDDDDIVVTPDDANSGAVQANGADPVVQYENTAGNAVAVDGDTGQDSLIVNATAAADTITVDVAGSSVNTGGNGGLVTYTNAEALTVNGQEGDDAFTVTPGAIPVFIDGGDPIGSTGNGDTIDVQAGNANTTFFPGPEGDAGGIDVGANETVSYDHIEGLTITDPDQLHICATNGDDEITVVATGTDDLQFSVNDSPLATVTDADSVLVEGKAGDDDLVFLGGTGFTLPVTLDADFSAASPAGTPSSDGDRVKISTPYAGETAEYRPTSSSGGTVTLTAATSVITIDDAETFHFDGEENGTAAFATALTVYGTADGNIIVHLPEVGDNEGTIRVDELLAVEYEGINRASQNALTINGQGGNDTVVAVGTPAADVFAVPGSPDIDLNTRIRINTADVESYILEGLEGDDNFGIVPVIDASVAAGTIPILVNAEGPSGSDHLTFVVNPLDAAPNDVTIATDSLPTTPEIIPSITQTGLGAVTLSGVEIAAVTTLANDLTLTGTRVDDEITFTPLSADSGTVSAVNVPTRFDFDSVPLTNSFTITGGETGLGGPTGGGFADKVIVNGTQGRDLMRVNDRVVSLAVLDFSFPGTPTEWRNVTLEGTNGIIETVTLDGRDGDDTFHVEPAAAVGNGLYINVDGGEPKASDALVITSLNAANVVSPLDADDFIIVHRSRVPDAGNVLPFDNSVRQPSISYENVEVVSPNINPVDRNTGDPNLLIMGPDLNEPNEYRENSAFLGSGDNLQILNGEIFPNVSEHLGVPEDHDYYRVVAKTNGTLDFQVYFDDLNGLVPGDGNINIEVLDVAGNVIAGTGTFGANEGAADQDERVRIPAVAGQTYYLHVFGGTTDVINGYDVTILNAPTEVAYDIELDDLTADNGYNCDADPPSGINSDTGRSHFDDITCDNSPTIVFRFDDALFLRDIQGNDGTVFTNNPPDTATGAIPIPFNNSNDPANRDAGYRLAVFLEGDPQQPTIEPQVPVGFAQPSAEPGVYTFDFDNANNGAGMDLTDGSHFINVRAQVIDPSVAAQTGYGPRSDSLEIIVDTVDPAVMFGISSSTTDGLHPDSDSGVQGNNPANEFLEVNFSDRITNDRTPTFYGLAEADSHIRVYLDVNQNNTVDAADVLLGQTSASPLDGNNQFSNVTGDSPNGQWQLTSTVDMNDPEARNLGGGLTALGYDGVRRILVTAEDVAGNINLIGSVAQPPDVDNDAQQILNIFIDTQGPQVTAVEINNQGHPYDLFDPKPSTDGPTPLVDRLVISVRDLPNRATNWLYQALEDRGENGNPAENAGHYTITGDFVGRIPIQSVTFTPDAAVNGSPATGTITLEFFEPLPDDRFTLEISDQVRDPAGNSLDGESHLAEPQENPTFPTGDGQPGGSFTARFTIDTRPELGTWASGTAWIDTNGNFQTDPTNLDFVNRDITYAFGNGSPNGNGSTVRDDDRAFTSDDLFNGNFSGPGPDGIFGTVDDRAAAAGNASADGFDKLGAFGSIGQGINGPWRFLIDYDNDGVPDVNQIDPNGGPGLPVAGNFDTFSANGDEIAIFTGSQFNQTTPTWHFDTDHDYRTDTSVVTTELRGYPIVGDFDGDGHDDLGTWTDDKYSFLLTNGTERAWMFGTAVFQELNFGFIGVRERPIAADFDQDGVDDIGLWVPDRLGAVPQETGEWYILVSDDRGGAKRAGAGDLNSDGVVNGADRFLATLGHAFEPIPFGRDLYAAFGDEFAVPLFGNFDPPASLSTGEVTPVPGEQTNPRNRFDVDANGTVTPIDVLLVINTLNISNGTIQFDPGATSGPFLDTDLNGLVTSFDALGVINYLNQNSGSAEGEGEFGGSILAQAEATDAVFAPDSESAALADSDLVGPASAPADEADEEEETDEADKSAQDLGAPVDAADLLDGHVGLGDLTDSTEATDELFGLENDLLDDLASDVSDEWWK